MKKHFVTFYSPGTFFHETTTKEIGAWNVEQAVEMAKDVVERHNSKPFGFQFKTVDKSGTDWNVTTEQVAESPMYYLGGETLTLEEVKNRNDENDSILISNMEYNGWNKIVVNTNSWKITQPLGESDVVLDVKI